jgi:hypothetical protein
MKKMTIARMVLVAALAVSVLGISGCSTVLTRMGPMIYRLEDGEKSLGDFDKYSKYKFSGEIASNIVYLEKTPVCPEIAEKLCIAQKQRRGRVFSMVETVFFGLGLVDAAKSQAVVELSKVVTPLAKYETGKFLACGEKQPASGEVLIIEDKQRTLRKQVETDALGRLNLDDLLAEENRTLNLSIRLASEQKESFSVIYTPGR